jgi:hypothetical protein
MQPITVHADYEQAVMSAVRNDLLIEPSGCLFHFAQNILRHVQQSGLQVAYNTNKPPEVRTCMDNGGFRLRATSAPIATITTIDTIAAKMLQDPGCDRSAMIATMARYGDS